MLPALPSARSAPIGDRQLAQLIQIATDAQSGNTDEARAEWLVSCCGPLLTELQNRRAFMAALEPAAIGTNIAFLPQHPQNRA